MKPQIGRWFRGRLAVAVPVLLALAPVLLVFGACSASPVPHQALVTAELAVSQAETAGAARHAPDELAEAQAKLEAANEAIEAKANDRARVLAEQATIDARVAAIEAEAAQAQAATDRLRDVLERQHRGVIPSRAGT
jgi:septal ring factor EnvC (AmiA/AmiB activator)